jgi:hypothetical protein
MERHKHTDATGGVTGRYVNLEHQHTCCALSNNTLPRQCMQPGCRKHPMLTCPTHRSCLVNLLRPPPLHPPRYVPLQTAS